MSQYYLHDLNFAIGCRDVFHAVVGIDTPIGKDISLDVGQDASFEGDLPNQVKILREWLLNSIAFYSASERLCTAHQHRTKKQFALI